VIPLIVPSFLAPRFHRHRAPEAGAGRENAVCRGEGTQVSRVLQQDAMIAKRSTSEMTKIGELYSPKVLRIYGSIFIACTVDQYDGIVTDSCNHVYPKERPAWTR